MYYDDFKKISITNNIDKAYKFDTQGKAFNVLTCSFPKKKRTEWEVILINDQACEEEVNDDTIEEKALEMVNDDNTFRYELITDDEIKEFGEIDWEDINEKLTKIYSQVNNYKEKISDQLSKIDLELCDCEHACEFFKYNVVKGYTLYRMIRERRRKRRFLKDEYRRASAVMNMQQKNISEGGLKKIFDKIDAQFYSPRVLVELFPKRGEK